MLEYVESKRMDVMRVATSSGRSEKVDEGCNSDNITEASSICQNFLCEVVNNEPLLILCSRLSVLDCSVDSNFLSREW
jgi:hypothetical protein